MKGFSCKKNLKIWIFSKVVPAKPNNAAYILILRYIKRMETLVNNNFEFVVELRSISCLIEDQFFYTIDPRSTNTFELNDWVYFGSIMGSYGDSYNI